MQLTRRAVLASLEPADVTGPLPETFTGVSTDTRTLGPGDLFVALQGERFDGHDYLAEAARRGAAAAVVSRAPTRPALPSITTDDTLIALGRLARQVRRELGLRVLAITGSVGKTTTKEMAAALCRAAGLRTLQTPGNWNNRVGLPLTLLGARGDEQVAVLELGINEAGEMAHLSAIAEPDTALITAVSTCHSAGLGPLEQIATEKLAIATGLGRAGCLVLPADEPLLRPPPGTRCTTFGWGANAQLRGRELESLGPRGSRFRYGDRPVQVSLLGEHNAANALAALAALEVLGVPAGDNVAALATLTPPALRGEVRTTSRGTHLLVDCYNANPRAVEAALASLAQLAGGQRKLAVLGDMRELGGEAEAGHRAVGRAAARLGFDELHLIGAATDWIREGAAAGIAAERIWQYRDREALHASIGRRLRPGDWLLIKGSRALGLEWLAEALLNRDAEAAE